MTAGPSKLSISADEAVRRMAFERYGYRVPSAAITRPTVAKIVSTTVGNQALVSLENLSNAAADQSIPTVEAHYEPRWGMVGGTWQQLTPPAGTTCLIVSSDTNLRDVWIVAFLGWPTD